MRTIIALLITATFTSGALAEPVDCQKQMVKNLAKLKKVAARLGASPAQVALAWLLAKSPLMLPIPGTASEQHLAENVAAAALKLGAEDLALLD